MIVQQGEELDEMYFVVSGTCKVVREVPNFFKSKGNVHLKFDITNYNQHLGAGAFLRLEELTKTDTSQDYLTSKKSTKKRGASKEAGGGKPLWSGESRNTTLSMSKAERSLPTLFLEIGTLSQYDYFADMVCLNLLSPATSLLEQQMWSIPSGTAMCVLSVLHRGMRAS